MRIAIVHALRALTPQLQDVSPVTEYGSLITDPV